MPPMKNIAVLFSGTGSNFENIAQNIPKDKYVVKLAITNNPNAKGIEIAKKYNIECFIVDQKEFQTREEFDAKVVQIIENHNIDLTVLAGFMRILTPVFTENIKSINLHPSLLPRHKGLNGIEKSFNDEHLEGGVSVHIVNDELDGGKIILQKSILKDSLTFNEYEQKIKKLEKESLLEAIQLVCEKD